MMFGFGKSRSDPRPKSAVSHGVGFAGLAALIIWIIFSRNFGTVMNGLGVAPQVFGLDVMPERADGRYFAFLCVVFCGLAMVAWSLIVDKVHRRASTGIDWTKPKKIADIMEISQIKLAGLWATWGIIAGLYGLCRWYWDGQYLFSMEVFSFFAPFLFFGSIPYVIWLDRYLVKPRDGAWHFGAMLCGLKDWEGSEVANHARSWAVKGFFFAFMVSIVPGGFGELVRLDLATLAGNPVAIAFALITGMFVVDVHFATVGYLLTMKPLDAHIRTANPYLAGWLAALMCYPPFILMGNGRPLHYEVDTPGWANLFANSPTVLIIWGTILVFLTGVYAWATMVFGLRFSNLTHRGILTHGPYGWTKHPAYLSKNAFWWLASLPFITNSGSWAEGLRNAAILAVISAIYYWRARTEEKHLMADPDYQAYAAWMDRNGPIPLAINKLLSLFKRNRKTSDALQAEASQPAE